MKKSQKTKLKISILIKTQQKTHLKITSYQ